MKRKKFIRILLSTAFLFAFSACSQAKSPEAANEIRFSLEGISDITISYDEETIRFYPAEGDELIVKEYMTEARHRYYASVTETDSGIHISEGGKPFFKSGFSRRIEVFLPDSYREALTVTTTDGSIDLTGVKLRLSKLHIDSTAGMVELESAAASRIHLSTTSGTLNLGSLEADNIRIDMTSGNVVCGDLTGYVEYTSTSGNAVIKSAFGAGTYKANNSGSLDVSYTEVTGDLYLFNKNGNINLSLPPNLAFEFEAAAKNGSVSTTFQEWLTVDGSSAHGVIGNKPAVCVKTETNNGTIEVVQ